MPVLVRRDGVEDGQRRVVHAGARRVLAIARQRARLDDDREGQEVDQRAGTEPQPDAALVARGDSYRGTAHVGHPLRPEPGMLGLLRDVERELHLRVGVVVQEAHEPQQEPGAVQLGVAVVAQQLEHARVGRHRGRGHSTAA